MSAAQDDRGAVLLPLELSAVALDALAERVAARLAATVAAEGFVGVREAAAHLACKPQRIYDLHGRRADARNPLPTHYDGSRLLFRLSEIDAWVARGGDCA